MNLITLLFVLYFVISININICITSVNNSDRTVNDVKEESIKNALQFLSEKELKEFITFYKEHERKNGDASDVLGSTKRDDIVYPDKGTGTNTNTNTRTQASTGTRTSTSEDEGGGSDRPKGKDKSGVAEDTVLKKVIEEILKDGTNHKEKAHPTEKSHDDKGDYVNEKGTMGDSGNNISVERKNNADKRQEKSNQNNEKTGTGVNNNKNDDDTNTQRVESAHEILKGTEHSESTTIGNKKEYDLEELLKRWNFQRGSSDTNKNHDYSGMLEHITDLLHNLHNNNNNNKTSKSETGGGTEENSKSEIGVNGKINKEWMNHFEDILNQYITINEQKKKAFKLDNAVRNDDYNTKESILLEHDGFINASDESEHDRSGNHMENGERGYTNHKGNMNENNAKLQKYFETLANNYNPYSYERKILDELANEEDIKGKYNTTEDFEKKIIQHFQKIQMNGMDDDDDDEQLVSEAMGDEAERKKERERKEKDEMFEDINEQDDNDSIEQGSISNRLLRKSQIGKNVLLKNLLNTTDDSLYECNCSSKVKNCLLYFMNLSNLEYILQSLEIDVKKMVDKYTQLLLERQELLKGKREKHSDSFLLPLPPLSKHANVKDISTYVLRVPKVIFLTTRKSFTASFDRYFYHLYNIMGNQLKWDTYLWGYGFKYYPIFYTKNLNILLHMHAHQLGRQPFDLIVVHESFVSSYYNHYFFMKNMPSITTLIYITDGWDITIKKNFLNLLPNIMFQNQVNIFEFNPLNTVDIEQEKKKLSNTLWNKVSNTVVHNIVKNKHKRKNDADFTTYEKTEKNSGSRTSDMQLEETLWAFLPHGVNHCCSTDYDQQFQTKEKGVAQHLSHLLANKDADNDQHINSYGYDDDDDDDEEEVKEQIEENETETKKKNSKGKSSKNKRQKGNDSLMNINKKYESSYALLNLFLPDCHYKNEFVFTNETRDIDVLFLYSTSTTKQNDFVVQKIMDNIYNKHMMEFKTPIKKYVVDTYFWKIWGLQTTHQLIKNKIQDYHDTLHRSKVCVISSKFAGTLNKMVLDALFNGCVVITDKSHNKNLNEYLVPAKIPFEYYEITDLIYNKENLETLSKDLIAKIKKTLSEVNSGKRDQSRIDAYKTVLSTYTYTGIILNWIIPSLYFYYNREKYELINNYFVLPHYFEEIITKSLQSTNAKREQIIASIDISLQEDVIMNNNEVFVWGIIWMFIFSIIFCYILKNSSFLHWFFTRRKEAYR